MKMLLKVCVVVLSLGLAIGCGSDGSKKKGATPIRKLEPKPEPQSLPLAPSIPFSGLNYKALPEIKCFERLQPASLPTVPEGAVVDGNTNEFVTLDRQFTDPVEVSGGFGVNGGWIQKTKSGGVWLALEGVLTGDFEVEIGFGRAVPTNEAMVQSMAREFRLQGDKLEIRVAGDSWRQVLAEDYNWAKGSTGAELELSPYLLGSITDADLWWVQIAVLQNGVTDRIAPFYSTNFPGRDRPRFEMFGCHRWTSKRSNLSLNLVVDRELWREEAQDTNTQLDRISEATWTAIEDVARFFGRGYPVSDLTLLVSDKKYRPEISSDLVGTKISTSRAVYVDISPLRSWSQHTRPVPEFYTLVVRKLIDVMAGTVDESFGAPEATAIIRSCLVSYASRDRFGLAYEIDRIAQFVDQFSLTDAPDNPVGLIELGRDQAFTFESAAAKLAVFGGLLAQWIPGHVLMEAANRKWVSAGELISYLDGHTLEDLAGLMPGWVESAPYASGLGPQLVSDDDQDGLVLAFEKIHGTDPNRSDTDSDGWSDIGELVLGFNPAGQSSHPGIVVADGSFDDWLDLIPGRIKIDEGREERCGKSSDVTHFGALIGKEELILGAFSAEFWQSNPDVYWEAILDFPSENRNFSLRVGAGSRSAELYGSDSFRPVKRYHRSFSMGQTFEWVFDRESLGLTGEFSSDSTQLKFRTVLKEGEEIIYCDETDWFTPTQIK